MQTFKQFLEEQDRIYAEKIEGAPDWSPARAEEDYRIGSVTFSAKSGLGAVPFNQSVYYHGFVAECRPSTFLELALPHEEERNETARNIATLSKEGYALGIPWFDMSLRDVEEHDGHPRITGHEGRGRMIAVREMIGDVAVPIHIILTGGMRARHLDDKFISAIKQAVYAQDGKKLISTPFSAIYVDGKKA